MPSSTPAISSCGRRPALGRPERHVRHPLYRHVGGGVGERAAVGPAEPLHAGHPPVELVAGEHAARDEVPGLGGDPLVVVADGGQAVPGGPVPGDVHHRGAVLQAAELVRGSERGARVRGLVAERPVQFGRVADRLVDDQPQVAGVDDQVVAAGPDAGGGQLPGQQPGQLGQLGGKVPGRGAGPGAAPQVLQPTPGRRRQRAHGLEPAAGLDRDRGHLRMEPHPLLQRGGGPVGVELALPDLVEGGVHVIDAVMAEQAGTPARQQGHLVGRADLQRVDLVGGHPADIAVGRARRRARWAPR